MSGRHDDAEDVVVDGAHPDYFCALERLENNRPERVPKGIKINNDSVSLEAGRKKGSIKKSRAKFRTLIEAIDAAAEKQNKSKEPLEDQLEKAKEETRKYRKLWDESLVREVSLVKQLWNERKEWAAEKSALTGEKVSTILAKKLSSKARRD